MAFAEISEENIKDLLSTKDSKETKRAVKRGVKLFRDYLTNKGVSSDFQNFAKCELNEHLRTCYASARKKDGDMMKTNSLTSLKYGISKYLKDTLEIDIKNDSEFSTSNTVYSAVLTDLKKKGLGSVDHKPAICPEDLFKIYDPSNVALNPNTLTGLLNKTWFDVMTVLCRRGRENLRDMTRDTFAVHVDGSGRRFVLQVQDENDKNHTVKDNPNDTIGEGRMNEKVGSSMCPVASFHCSDEVWYTKTPLDKNTLSSMMSNISKLSKLSMIYTNHSIRATAITEIDEAGIDTRHIMRVSGHKSESSIKHYTQRLSEKKKREILDCLSETLMKASDSKACKAETTSNLQSTSTATSTVMNTEQQPDVSDLDFLFDNNDL